MFVYKWKKSLETIFFLLVAGFFIAVLWILTKFPFPQNANTQEFYLYSASSQAERKTELSTGEIFFLQGTSYEYQTDDSEKFVEELIHRFRAIVVREEKIANTYSYYCYSPMLGKTTVVDGAKINLHVAVNGKKVKIGSPIIFGGY